jgi:2-polyprenyl-3-methyl-5-hydroxy-6-metoxy-1,4-benzoquinol methylase
MNPNTQAFYDTYWGGASSASYLRDRQLDEIAAYIVGRIGKPPQQVMDLGGGVSRIARLAKQVGHIPFVVDFSAAAIRIMTEEDISAQVYDIRRWRGRRLTLYTDVVTCTEVLEHLDDPDQAVRMARSHAGRAFFTVPDNCMGPAGCAMHVRTYTQQTLLQLLRAHYDAVSLRTMYRWIIAECEA